MRNVFATAIVFSMLLGVGCSSAPGQAGFRLERIYSAHYYPMHLHAGDDLEASLRHFASEHQLSCAYVASVHGTLRKTSIRLVAPDSGADVVTRDQRSEILSLSGTFSVRQIRMAISVADPNGATLGGQLLPGCIADDEVELLIGEIEGLRLD